MTFRASADLKVRSSAALILIALVVSGCKKKSDDGPTTPEVPAGPVLTGTIVNGASNQTLAGAKIHVDGVGDTTSAGDGTFAISTPDTSTSRAITITSSSTIERMTWLTTPGTAGTLPLMPTSIGLTAFNEMFRSNQNGLRRWTTAPRLIIQRSSLAFTSINDSVFTATSTILTDAEVNQISADLNFALPQLTGNAFSVFANEGTETATAGDQVSIFRTGAIFVARYSGLTTATAFNGYTRWSWNGAGEVMVGTIMLDQQFEGSGSPFRRSLRSHELGHALGYNHVMARSSVMSPQATVEPNALDRDSARLAFLRPLLNETPDTDVDPRTITFLSLSRLFTSGAP